MNPDGTVPPQKNRGPGAMDVVEAKSARQRLSHTKRSSLTKKNETEVACDVGQGLVSTAGEVMGDKAAATAAYYESRHKLGKKGQEIPAYKKRKIDSILGEENVDRAEALVRAKNPKFRVGPEYSIGSNRSASLTGKTPVKSVAIGLKNSLRSKLSNVRGLRLAAHGVNLLNLVAAELTAQNLEDYAVAPPGTPFPPPPTDEEIKACVQQCVLLGWNNRNRNPHTPVSKSTADHVLNSI